MVSAQKSDEWRLSSSVGSRYNDRRPPCLTLRPGLARHPAERPDGPPSGERVPMSADPLSDLLKTVRLTGGTFFDVVAKTPWVAESPPRQMIVQKILPGAGYLIAYHVVTEGRCFATVFGEEAMTVEAGEVIVFTKGDAHALSSRHARRSSHHGPAGLRRPSIAFLPRLWRRRAGFGKVRLRLPRLRRPAFQSAAREPAAGDQDRRTATHRRWWLGQFLRFAMLEFGGEARRR